MKRFGKRVRGAQVPLKDDDHDDHDDHEDHDDHDNNDDNDDNSDNDDNNDNDDKDGDGFVKVIELCNVSSDKRKKLRSYKQGIPRTTDKHFVKPLNFIFHLQCYQANHPDPKLGG